jgi:hypothetical protein
MNRTRAMITALAVFAKRFSYRRCMYGRARAEHRVSRSRKTRNRHRKRVEDKAEKFAYCALLSQPSELTERNYWGEPDPEG